MKLGIMQPYFLPYLGYWQLMNHVDVFVIYDNIQFSKKGWIHRNRMLQNGNAEYFSLPMKKDSDYLDVCERRLSDRAEQDLSKLLRKIEGSYRKSPNFKEVFPIIERIFKFDDVNLFKFIHHSLSVIKEKLSIDTDFVISSTLDIDHELKGQEKVMAISKHLNATEYINPIGGVELYNKDSFAEEGIHLGFLQADLKPYSQFKNEFVPGLSVLDLMMFNSTAQIDLMLKSDYTIV